MRKRYANYFVLAFFLFLLLNLPKPYVASMRKQMLFATEGFAGAYPNDKEAELMHLKIENRTIKEQLDYVKTWLHTEERIDELVKKVETFTQVKGHSSFYRRRIDDLTTLLQNEVTSINARVIFRDPAFWSSGLWIDRGERDNRKLERKVIAKNSPVLVGASLIGVIEIVEEERSYVRLITDASLTPAVRAVRGDEQNESLVNAITSLEEELKIRDDLQDDYKLFMGAIKELKEKLSQQGGTSYLAKGELRGSGHPLWRSRSSSLKGVGFNYEFGDEEGGARTLHLKEGEGILHRGDLLITSGLDGLFPAGLKVATVSKIFPLKEGGFAYEIEALPTVGNLSKLTFVQIYPPLSL